ncbi:MAG TPA: DUF1330 domain-containing protein [Solirubrobacterales bacterium]|nr:DUF1330 domain-containing protein [Solirubrobacterales bacterium]
MDASAGIDAPTGPEPLNKEGFAAFAARTEEQAPVVMLNLLRFKPDGGRERYGEYGAAVAPLLEAAGGRIVFAGDPATVLLGERSWDMVLLVEYPTRSAFLEMIGSEAYQTIAHLRTEALVAGELHPLDPGAIELP